MNNAEAAQVSTGYSAPNTKNLQLKLIAMFRAMAAGIGKSGRVRQLQPYQIKQRLGEEHLRNGVLRFDSSRASYLNPRRKTKPRGKSAVRAAKLARRLARPVDLSKYSFGDRT